MQFDMDAAFEAVDFDGFNWRFLFDSGISVSGVQTLWRLLVAGRIEWVSEDHLQQFGLPAPVDLVAEMTTALSGNALQRIVIDDVTSDLRLTFADGAEVQVFTASAGYESWSLQIGDERYICGGGGRLMLNQRISGSADQRDR